MRVVCNSRYEFEADRQYGSQRVQFYVPLSRFLSVTWSSIEGRRKSMRDSNRPTQSGPDYLNRRTRNYSRSWYENELGQILHE